MLSLRTFKRGFILYKNIILADTERLYIFLCSIDKKKNKQRIYTPTIITKCQIDLLAIVLILLLSNNLQQTAMFSHLEKVSIESRHMDHAQAWTTVASIPHQPFRVHDDGLVVFVQYELFLDPLPQHDL